MRGCLLLSIVFFVLLSYVFYEAGYFDTSSLRITRSTVQKRVTAIPTQRAISSRSRVPAAKVATATIAATTSQNFLFHVCPDRVVNLRIGAGFSNYAIAGEMIPGRSYPVLAHVEGESVQGNTTWYQIELDGKTAYVTAHYTYACDNIASSPAQKIEASQQATVTFITTCKDQDLLDKAQASKEFSHNDVGRAIAFCVSKQIMVDLKVNGVFDTLDEAKREMYVLLCALRQNDYGITFDVDGNFYDVAGNKMESRAVLARFEADVVGRINCDSYHGAVNWDYAAEEWWVHRALSD